MTAVTNVTGAVVQNVVGQVTGAGSLSGRSVSCLSVIAQVALWTVTAVAVAALAIQLFLFLFPFFLSMFPLLALATPIALGISALGATLCALAIRKLTPEKKLETVVADLQAHLQQFAKEIEEKLPALLKDVATEDKALEGADKTLEDDDKQLKEVACQLDLLLNPREGGFATMNQSYTDLMASISKATASLQEKKKDFDALAGHVAALNDEALRAAIAKVEEQKTLLLDIQKKNEVFAQEVGAILASLKTQEGVVVAASKEITGAAEALTQIKALLPTVVAEEEKFNKELEAVLARLPSKPS